MDSGFQITDSGFFVSGTWIPDLGSGFRIPIVRGILHSFSCIPDSANKNSTIREIRIPLNGAKYSSLVIYSCEMVGYQTVKMMSAQFWQLTWINKNVTCKSTYSLFQIFNKDLLPAVLRVLKGTL